MTGAWRWSLVAVAATGFALAAIPVLLFWPQLPEPMAVHWSIDLRPNGAMTKQSALLLNAALVGGTLLLALIGATAAYARGRAVRLVIVTLSGSLAAAASATIVARNLGKTAWTDAEPLTAAGLTLMLGVPLAAAALSYLIGLRVWSDARPPALASSPPLPLGADTRAFWSSGASNRWLLAIGAVLLAQAFVLLAMLPQLRMLPAWIGIHTVVLFALELFSTIRVAIDGRGIAIRYGHLGLWTRRVPLESIAAAHAIKLDALEHGGWGYRGGLRLFGKAAIVVRSGDAVRLDLRDGKQLFVTVDDAATAARLLNGLIERGPATPALPSGHRTAGA